MSDRQSSHSIKKVHFVSPERSLDETLGTTEQVNSLEVAYPLPVVGKGGCDPTNL